MDASFEWALTQTDHSGAKKFREGKNCKDCHQALIKAKLKKSSEAPTSCNKCMHD